MDQTDRQDRLAQLAPLGRRATRADWALRDPKVRQDRRAQVERRAIREQLAQLARKG